MPLSDFVSGLIAPVEDDGQDESHQGEGHSGQGGILESPGYGQSAGVGSDCVAEVEGYLYAGSAQHLSARRHADNQQLLGTGNGKEAHGAEEHERNGQPGGGREEEDGQQHQADAALRHHQDASRRVAVGQAPAGEVAHHHAESGQHHQGRHAAFGKAGHLGQQRTDVAVPAEYAAVAQRRSAQNQPGAGWRRKRNCPLKPTSCNPSTVGTHRQM